ncbi:Carboxylesterase 1 [Glycine soja]|uniref:Carboxylesterase 1 n=1 Tax=Glycine soja TaxID=3848 RepID=A0A0B2QTR8_GLYSO|nr:Carboxylesterase 1 [Glycine soja]
MVWFAQFPFSPKVSVGLLLIYVGLRAIEEENGVEALKIQGLILCQALFGDTKRTGSELRPENNPFIPLCVTSTDLMWELALPIGANRDHEYFNPRAGNVVEKLDKMREHGWRVLVSGNGGDRSLHS